MMNDIHEIKTTDTKLDELRQENEMLKSELSNKAIKQAEDSKLYHTEITNIKGESNVLLNEKKMLQSELEGIREKLYKSEDQNSSVREDLRQVCWPFDGLCEY